MCGDERHQAAGACAPPTAQFPFKPVSILPASTVLGDVRPFNAPVADDDIHNRFCQENDMFNAKRSCKALLLASVVIVGAGAAAAASAACRFGECGPSAPTETAPTPVQPRPMEANVPRKLAEYRSWVVMKYDRGVMVIDSLDRGAKFAIVKTAGEVRLILHDPSWSLREGDSFTLPVTIDGRSYRATGTATDATDIAVRDVRDDVMREMLNAETGVIEVGGATWTLSFSAAARAIHEAVSRSDRSDD